MTNVHNIEIKEEEFQVLQKIIFINIGININHSKKMLVETRLQNRLHQYGFLKFKDYIRLVQIDANEKTQMLNLITTNETYFFREKLHFEFLNSYVDQMKSDEKVNIWSAAASVGAEAYSIAMTLDSRLHKEQYSIIASDVNTEVINKAIIGLYPESWLEKIDPEYIKHYCLKGTGIYKGKFLIERSLVKNIKFEVNNLLFVNNTIGKFDIIFLRNVLLYFSEEMRKQIIINVLHNLKDGGYLVLSVTENIKALGISCLEKVQHSIYKKVPHADT